MNVTTTDLRYEYIDCACGHKSQRIDAGSAQGEPLCGFCWRMFGIAWDGKPWRQLRAESDARVAAVFNRGSPR